MATGRRQRNKKKNGTERPLRQPKGMTVKVKPKEQEPCRTRNPQPKIRTPLARADRRKILAATHVNSALSATQA
jgi:hypothetical protein